MRKMKATRTGRNKGDCSDFAVAGSAFVLWEIGGELGTGPSIGGMGESMCD
jgi:hypothetical protein